LGFFANRRILCLTALRWGTDGLTSKNLAEIDLFVPQTDAAAARDHDGFVVEGIVEIGPSGVETWGRFGRPRPGISCPELRAGVGG